MANYYTNFSLVFVLPSKAARDKALEIVAQVERIKNEEILPLVLPECLQPFVEEDWWFEAEAENNEAAGKWGLWLHSENGGIDAACEFLRYLLREFDPTSCVSFEWSNDCSKPRTDAYGGGAAFVTAKEIKTMNTSSWVDKQTKRWNAKIDKPA